VDIGLAQYFDGSNFIQINTTKIFAEVQILDLTLGRFIDIQAVLIENLNVYHALVKGRYMHMYAAKGICIANKITRYRYRYPIDIMDADTSRGQTSVDTTLNHTRSTMSVTIKADNSPLGQNRTIRSSKLGREFRSKVNVDQPGHAIATEEAATPLRTPDDTGIDHSTGFDIFIGPDLDIGLNNSTILNDRIVANDRALKHHRFAFDVGRGTND